MNLKLKSIAEKGNFEKERLVINVLNDADVGDYILMQTGIADGNVSIAISGTYWFPNKAVKAGDLVVLYSKSGINKDRDLDGGRKAHFFYWGKSAAIWNKPEKAAVLAHAPTWSSASADEL
ncbi:MAG: hypothetical protein JNK17_10180 [Hydrogenophaga sp.]|nr:hypothetical protein [Hydrogenophaga sp.]